MHIILFSVCKPLAWFYEVLLLRDGRWENRGREWRGKKEKERGGEKGRRKKRERETRPLPIKNFGYATAPLPVFNKCNRKHPILSFTAFQTQHIQLKVMPKKRTKQVLIFGTTAIFSANLAVTSMKIQATYLAIFITQFVLIQKS